jgi:general secretion pathway protein K
MAILMAMLTLALVATLAAGVLWQQWRTQEQETSSRYQEQADWLLGAALDWARVILNEDAKAGNTDNKTEPWSIPLQETQLSTFLSASGSGVNTSSALTSDGSGGINDAQSEQIYLSGRITDLQSRLNISNLYIAGQISTPDLNAFTQLFTLLGIPESELNRLVQGAASGAQSDSAPQSFISPQRIEQLSWLGISPQTLAAVSPFVTWLPVRTPLNLNTAPPQVLAASFNGLSLSKAQTLAKNRDAQPWTTLDEASRALSAVAPGAGQGGASMNSSQFALNSSYFQVYGRLRFENLVFTQRSVLQRTNQQTLILWRERRATGAEPGCFSTIEPPC